MKRLFIFVSVLLCLAAGSARAAVDPAALKALASDDFDARLAAIARIAAGADQDALRILKALSEDALAVAGERIVIVEGDTVRDAATGQVLNPAPANPEPISLNNSLRGELDSVLAGMRLLDPDRTVRLEAAKALQEGAGESLLPLLDKALKSEQDPEIRQLLAMAHARASIASQDAGIRLGAARTLAASQSSEVRALLAARLEKSGDTWVEADEKVRLAVQAAVREIDGRLARGEMLARVFSGLSLGSILLLAALGLAITYGVMGVINMAHGELLMVGAYSAYAMQGLFRAYLPTHEGWYLAAAVPVAFGVAALVGMAMERSVIRFLYGRPLETLLATWGLSLVLIQAARLLFGAQNVEVSNPAWMSGGIELMANLTLPWNRIVIVAFAGFVLLLVWLMMNRTRLGMFVRAVTQNRP
ncbi:MAG: urea ABC transporter permease subunit UrtB, partial [Zoogloea sp.]|nr:urea ABC transporter permease subunit UrtB [Zoogloea sp.]